MCHHLVTAHNPGGVSVSHASERYGGEYISTGTSSVMSWRQRGLQCSRGNVPLYFDVNSLVHVYINVVPCRQRRRMRPNPVVWCEV